MIRDRIKEASIPACITLIIFMGVLFAKGIFPFGDLRIDYYDMGQTNAPLYYHIWDFLHGKGGLFYSWYIDEGQNLAMGSSIQWNISVFNLFFLFITRSAVMKSLSVFMGLHLFFMAFNMDLLLRHTVHTPRFYRILFSTAYGLTGFTLTHYTIPTYLDTAALMPLYLITLYDVLKEPALPDTKEPESGGKRKWMVYIKPAAVYALMTGYMTGLGYYMAFMNLIFVLLVSGTYIFVLCGTGEEADASRKDSVTPEEGENPGDIRRRAVGRAAVRLGIGTFAGIGISSFMLLPAAMQMMKSSRFNSNLSGGLLDTLHNILWAIGADMYYIKWWLLSGSLAAIVILLSGLIHFRKERRVTVFFFLFCMYPCALIVFESINLLWHMGTYYHYPIRCGYLIPIVLLTTAAYYTGRFEKLDYVNHNRNTNDEENTSIHVNTKKKSSWSYVNYSRPISVAFDVAALIACGGLIYFYISHDTWQIEELFRAWVIFAAVLTAVYALIWCVLKRPAYIAPVLIMELAVTAYVGYGQPNFVDKYSSDPEQSGDYVTASQALSDSLGITESRTDRIKNPDTTLNTNYGFIMRRATVGGWANTVPRPQMDSCIALGYGAHFMRILDCGGTLLSDAALHVTETLAVKPDLYTGEAWERRGEAEGYTLYDNKYTLPFVMRIGSEKLLSDNMDDKLSEMGFAEATNTLYRWLAKEEVPDPEADEEAFLAGLDEKDRGPAIVKDITGEVSKGSYYVNQKKALYLYGGKFDRLTINDRVIPIPDIGDPDGTSYPAWFNSGLIFLGIYEDEEIKLEGAKDKATKFYEFDMEKLDTLCEGYRGEEQEMTAGRCSLSVSLSGEDGQVALIPLAYDSGFRAKVNGRRAEIRNVSDIFMAVPLEPGENLIELSFTPDGLVPGIILTLIFLGMTVFFSVKPIKTGAAEKPGALMLALLWSVFIIVLYLIPYIAFVIHQIEKRLL